LFRTTKTLPVPFLKPRICNVSFDNQRLKKPSGVTNRKKMTANKSEESTVSKIRASLYHKNEKGVYKTGNSAVISNVKMAVLRKTAVSQIASITNKTNVDTIPNSIFCFFVMTFIIFQWNWKKKRLPPLS
jgi:hypothetical protein